MRRLTMPARTGWLPYAGAALLMALFAALGFWQLDRAAQKQALIAEFELRAAQPPVRIAGGAPGDLGFRRVVVTGTYLPRRQFLLDNRVERRRAGYHVLTPFVPDGGSGAVLVNRGWVPQGRTRQDYPDLSVSGTGTVTVTGIAHPNPGDMLVLSEADGQDGSWPRVVQRIDYARMERALGVPLLRYVVLLDPDAADGYVRAWKPNYGIPPDKHRAYALQWFSFAVVLAVIVAVTGFRGARPGGPRTDGE